MGATTFKLKAAEFHLQTIVNLRKTWKSIIHEKARFKASIAVDGFLCELMSAVDSLLHDINDGLKLGIPAEEVNLMRVQKEMRKAKYNEADLGDLNSLYSEEHWLYDLRKLRNYSVHQSLLGRAILYDTFTDTVKICLPKPWIPGGRTEKEVIPYFRDQLKNVRKLVKDVKTRLHLHNMQKKK